jgi:hypothetical protein
MKLVEPEAEGPIEGEEPIVTAPRPPHRRVSVSFLFTLTVLVGTVVAIYVIFPARHNLLLTEAMEAHREQDPQWDLVAPPINEMRTWAIGVAGKDVPLPPENAKILSARQTNIHNRRAAIVRFSLGADELTYLVQHGRGIPPKRSERTDGDLHAVSWKSGKFTCVVVGPSATKDTWIPQVSTKK